MNSNMVKPEKVDHLHLVYHITVPLGPGTLKSAFRLIFLTKTSKTESLACCS